MKSIADRLRLIRKERHLSQKALGARLRSPQSHVSAIETGQVDPRLSSLAEIARALDHELMLVPRALLPAVKALLSGKTDEPLWKIDEAEEAL